MLDTHVGWHSRWIYKGMCCFSNAYIPYAQPNSRIICTFKSNFNNVPLIQDKEILYFNKYFLIKLPNKMYQFTQVLKNCIVYFIASELNFTASHITSCLQLFLERLSEIMCMRQSWKVNMGYDQYTVADTNRSCLIYFRCFPLARTNIHPWSLVPFFQISLKNSELKTTHNTFCALFLTTFLKIAVYEVNHARLLPCFFLRRRRADLLAKITVVWAENSASGVADLI